MPRLLIDATPVVPQAKGVGRYAYNLCLQLAAQLPQDWTLQMLAWPEGVQLFPHNFRGEFLAVRRHSEIVTAMRDLQKYVARAEPDILLKTEGNAGYIAGLPTVTVCHDIDELILGAQLSRRSVLRRCLDAWKYRLRKKVLQASDFVVCNSEFTRRSLQSFYQVPEKKSAVAYCAIDPRFYRISRQTAHDHMRRKLGIGNYLLTFATGDPRENFTVLPSVAAKLAETGVKTCLVVAGLRFNAPYVTELRRDFAGLGLTEGVHFKLESFLAEDRFDDLAALYAGADFYLELSLHEGFGMQLAEAMACGTACISSPNGALAEVGDHYAVFVDPRSADDLAAAIRNAYARGLHLRDNADQVAYTRRFSWEETGRVVANVLLQTLEAHRR